MAARPARTTRPTRHHRRRRRAARPEQARHRKRPMALVGRQLVRATGMMQRVAIKMSAIDAGYVRGARAGIPPELVRAFVHDLLAEEVHAKRVASIANAVTGVTRASTLSIQMIGHGLSAALDKNSKHAIKQVDRLLSNAGVDVWALFATWVPYVLADRSDAVVAIDWTDFEPDDHVTCAAHLVTNHGRATALVWKTIPKSALKGQQTRVEDEVIERLHAVVPAHVDITLLADRAFGDQVRYTHLTQLGWDYVIRFRDNIIVSHGGEAKPAAAWVPARGRARQLIGAAVTNAETTIGAVVCVKRAKMKEAWCLATSRADPPPTRSSSCTAAGSPSRRPSATRRICASAWVCPQPTSATAGVATACCFSPRSRMHSSRCSAPRPRRSATTA